MRKRCSSIARISETMFLFNIHSYFHSSVSYTSFKYLNLILPIFSTTTIKHILSHLSLALYNRTFSIVELEVQVSGMYSSSSLSHGVRPPVILPLLLLLKMLTRYGLSSNTTTWYYPWCQKSYWGCCQFCLV